MLGVSVKISTEGRQGEEAPPVENIPLWLPSSLTRVERENMCQPGLGEMEAQLREAQCNDALTRLRALLRQKTHFIKHKNAHVRNQRRTTRAVGLIDGVSGRIGAVAAKYRRAREALLALKGTGDWENGLKPLLPSNLRGPGEFTIKDANDRIGPSGRLLLRARRDKQVKRLGEGYRMLSWIWMGGVAENDAQATQELNLGKPFCRTMYSVAN